MGVEVRRGGEAFMHTSGLYTSITDLRVMSVYLYVFDGIDLLRSTAGLLRL